MNIVSFNSTYNYDIFLKDIYALKNKYPFIYLDSIGNSVLGNAITLVKIGNGKKEVFYSASIHANEWITTPILMKFIEDLCESYVTDSNIYGYSAKHIFDDTSIYLVPMINPDGVNLVTGFLPSNSSSYIYAKSIANNYPNIPFPNGWKANIEGVDFKKYQPIFL